MAFAAATLAAAVLAATGAQAQAVGGGDAAERGGWRLDASLGYTSPLVSTRDGLELRTGVSGALAAGRSWVVAPRWRLAASARAAAARLTAESDGASWETGTGLFVDLAGEAERAVTSRLTLAAGAGVVWMLGPDDVGPFVDGGGFGSPHPAVHVGAAYALSAGRPFAALFTAQAFRMGGKTVSDPVSEPGAVVRLLLGLRYGR